MPVYDFRFPANAAGLSVQIRDAAGSLVSTVMAGAASGVQGGVVVSASLDVGEYTGTAENAALFESYRSPGFLNVDSTLEALPGTFVARRVRLILGLGQSNMSGRGTPYSSFLDPINARIKQFGSGASALTAASEPLLMHDTPTGIGPLLQFARNYLQVIPDLDVIVLVPAAHGGSGLSDNSTLAWRWGVSGNLTAQAITQTQAAIAAAEAAYPGATISVDAVLWAQGEWDGTSGGGVGTPLATYKADLDALIAGLRTTFGNSELPFIIQSMAPEYFATAAVGTINAAHADTPYRVAHTGFALGSYGYVQGDGIHLTGPGQRVYARRVFEEFQRVRSGLAPVNPINGLPTPPEDGYHPFDGIAIADTFTRTAADLVGTTPNTGNNWEGISGRFLVNGTRVGRHASLGSTSNRVSSNVIGDMREGSIVVRVATNLGASQTTRINFQANSTESECLRVQISGSTSATCQLVLVQATVGTVLATWAAGTIPSSTAAADYNLSWTVDGLAVTATLNGITVNGTLTADQKAVLAGGRYVGVSTTHPAGFELDNLSVRVVGLAPD